MAVGRTWPESLGALLARVRGEQGVTQLRLADRLCAASGQATVTRHEVSRWEREERIPSGYWLGWLAVVLDLPLEELERAAGEARRFRRGPRRPVVPPPWVEQAPGVYRRAS
jgi:transcriptional regulator with XRE-family HTH domain